MRVVVFAKDNRLVFHSLEYDEERDVVRTEWVQGAAPGFSAMMTTSEAFDQMRHSAWCMTWPVLEVRRDEGGVPWKVYIDPTNIGEIRNEPGE